MSEERLKGSYLSRLVAKGISFATRTEERVFVLTGGVDRILRENPRRLSYLVCNRGVVGIDLGFSPNLVLGEGIFLPGGGGCITMLWEEDGEAVGYAMYAIGASGSKIYLVECIATGEGGV